MKQKKLLLLFIASVFSGLILSCEEDNEDKLSGNSPKGSMNTVERITGFSSEITGAGASLTITGKNLAAADFVTVDNIFGRVDQKSAEAVTITVPASVGLGEKEVVLYFQGGQKAISSIEVVPLPVIYGVSPAAVSAGDQIVVRGKDFNIVTAVSFGELAVTPTEQTDDRIVFTVPASPATGKIKLTSPAGSLSSSLEIVSCSQSPANDLCKTPINLNTGFEGGSGDNFDNWGKWNGGGLMTATTVPTEVFAGSRGLKVNVNGTQGGTDQWRIQMASDLFVTDVGADYKVMIWAKAAASGGTIRFSTQPSAQYGPNTPVTTGWTLITWTFKANVAETRLMLDMGGAFNTSYYIDEVRVVKL